MDKKKYFPSLKSIMKAEHVLSNILSPTPLSENRNLSAKFEANVLLKREDLQMVRSYKIRGAYNMIKSLSPEELQKGVTCASAGNHAQGVAYSCSVLKIRGKIFIPVTAPKQKVNQVKMFGAGFVEVILIGDNFDQANDAAIAESKETGMIYVPAFNHPKIIEGQATVGMEITRSVHSKIDYIFVPIGGGGLAAGVGSFFKQISPTTKVIGVEPMGAQSMRAAFDKGGAVMLDEMDKFVDGAAVQKVGDITYDICKDVLDDIIAVPEGKICTTILELYNFSAMVVEPAGALSIAGLDFYKDKIKGKNVVCVVSGGNNDITRMEEIKERSMLYEGHKHYFIISFPQRSGALKDFVNEVLGENDDITYFEYKKKINREKGPAIVGIELYCPDDLQLVFAKMQEQGIQYEYLNNNPILFEQIIGY